MAEAALLGNDASVSKGGVYHSPFRIYAMLPGSPQWQRGRPTCKATVILFIVHSVCPPSKRTSVHWAAYSRRDPPQFINGKRGIARASVLEKSP